MKSEDESLAEIPKEFYSTSSGGLFQNCIECDKYLLDPGTEYLIEKAMKNYPGFTAQDTIFDYAICMDCAMAMHQKMSKESLSKMEAYFKEHLDPSKRNADLSMDNPEGFTERCLIKETSKSESSEFQVYAHCLGDKIFLGNPPYMICGEAMEEVMSILSKATKDELGGFFNKHFSPDPDLFQTDPKLILI